MQKFNISADNIPIFDYNAKDDAVMQNLQKAYTFFKAHTKDNSISFMKFCSDLKKLKQFSSHLSKNLDPTEESSIVPHRIFISFYNREMMLFKHPELDVYSFVSLAGVSKINAVNEYISILKSNFGIEIEAKRFNDVGQLKLAVSGGKKTICRVNACFLNFPEYQILTVNDKIVKFECADKIDVINNRKFDCVKPLLDLTRHYLNSAKIKTNQKKKELCCKNSVKTICDESEMLNDKLVVRLHGFESSLEEIMKRYNL